MNNDLRGPRQNKANFAGGAPSGDQGLAIGSQALNLGLARQTKPISACARKRARAGGVGQQNRW